MADTYLPADVRKRIIDVMRERKLTQRELALRIDVNESTISRFLSGKTEKLSEESVIRIARVFNVSTDFILGTTVIPDKKNYDISELGLSVEAAKNLYTCLLYTSHRLMPVGLRQPVFYSVIILFQIFTSVIQLQTD